MKKPIHIEWQMTGGQVDKSADRQIGRQTGFRVIDSYIEIHR